MTGKQKIIIGIVALVFVAGVAGVLNFALSHKIARDSGTASVVVRTENIKQGMEEAVPVPDTPQSGMVSVTSKADAEKALQETESAFDDMEDVFSE